MDQQTGLRKHVVTLLAGKGAHADLRTSLKDMPEQARGKRPDGLPHSAWELLEHLRIAQWDILEFSRNPKHQSPKWPEGYWPKSPMPPDAGAWDKSVKAFEADAQAMVDLINDEKRDLLAPLDHDKEKTLLREALLLADHNAYHIGQIVLVRRLLGAWKD